MNIKKKTTKLMSLLLSFAMTFSGVIPAYAMENTNGNSTAVIDGEDISADERNLEDITVTYKQASSFFVTIPKTIVLDGWKQSAYAVKVSGDIDADQCVYVAPVDGITDTDSIDFYMKDQASENTKEDVVANVTHNKFHWNSTEVAENYRQDDNMVSAPDLTAGAWRGIFQMEIKLETHVTHKHNYVETITKEPTCTEAGEKKYTCDCGDSYTEEIPATGHKDTDGDGVCDECGEKDSDHKHSYTETITKQPTCTEAGEKTYTCDCGDTYTVVIPATGHHYGDDDKCTGCGELNPDHKHSYTETITKQPTCTEKGEKKYTCGCGDSYTEEIAAKGHNFVDGECTNCGEKEPDPYETAPAEESQNWNYTLNDVNDVITLNYYIGKNSETAREVIVYANYTVNGKVYKTQLASNTQEATKRYMFNAYYQDGLQLITSIKFSKNIDTSNVTCMDFMFRDCHSLSTLDISHFDTSNVTSMRQMFSSCKSLINLNVDSFDTSNVTRMDGMFSYLESSTDLDISSFDTRKVTRMDYMFSYSKNLKTIYATEGKWSTSQARTTDMFKYCGTSTVTYK